MFCKLVSKSVLALVVILAFVSNALAATITVTSFNDDFNLEDSSCTLREAVIAANTDTAFGGCTAGSGDDTISLAVGTYTLTRSCDVMQPCAADQTQTCSANQSFEALSDSSTECDDLDIYTNIIIQGAGKNTTIITVDSDTLNTMNGIKKSGLSFDYGFRVFDLHSSQEISSGVAPACEDGCEQGNVLALKDLSINGGEDYNGGAVRVKSENECEFNRLETLNVLFSENYADYNGGAVYVYGQFSANNTEFTENEADENGGAVYLNWGTQCPLSNSILNSTFDNNNSYDGLGGALFTDTDTTTDIAGSTFQNNHAYIAGGAIAGFTGALTINNSTVTNNGQLVNQKGFSVPTFGGGIFAGNAYDYFDDLTAGNTITAEGSDYYGQGGTLTLLIQNSTVSDNRALIGGGGLGAFEFLTLLRGINLKSQETPYFNSLVLVNTTVRDSDVSDNEVKFYQQDEFEDDIEFEAKNIISFPELFLGQMGGGILNASLGKLVVEKSTVDSNTAPVGGGIANLFDSSVTKSAITNNDAVLGGFIAVGSTSAQDSEDTFVPTLNFTGGGGIFNGGSADVTNTTVSGNTTDGSGAGILNYTTEYYAQIYEFTQAELESDGGEEAPVLEIGEIGAPGTRLNNNTVVSNEIVKLTEGNVFIPFSAQMVSPFLLNNGGGIASLVGKIYVSNNIIAKNKDDFELIELFTSTPVPSSLVAEASPVPDTEPVDPIGTFGNFAPDCYVFPADVIPGCQASQAVCQHYTPEIISEEHNLIGNNLGCTSFQPAANTKNDRVGTPDSVIDPLLSPLANNGGNTLSHLPQQGSQAIDNGSGAAISANAVSGKPCLADDQRSAVRPVDGNNDSVALCDIGSLEVTVDCLGVPGGSAVKDACGVCAGNGSSCIPTPTPTVAPTPVPDAPLSCVQQNIAEGQIVLDGSAHSFAQVTNKLYGAINISKKAKSNTSSQVNGLVNKAWTVVWSLPQVMNITCTGGASVKCISVSNEASKASYLDSMNQLYKINQNLIAKIKNKKRKARFQKSNDAILATAISSLDTIPSGSVSCS